MLSYVIKVLVGHQRLMHQQSLHGVAGCRIVSLGVNHNLDGLVQVGVLIKIGVADAVSMAKDGDSLGSLLDRPDQLVRASGNDEVNVVVQLQQIINLISA